MTNIKAIIFDVDDTLIQTFNTLLPMFQEVGREYELRITKADLRAAWGLPYQEFLETLFKSSDTIESLYQKYLEAREDIVIPIFPHVRETLDYLKSSYSLAALTSTDKKTIIKDLQNCNLEQYFTFIHTADDTTFHKPDQRVFDSLLASFKELNILPVNTVYIGDHVNDYKASIGAGMNFIAILSGQHDEEDFINAGHRSDLIISDIYDLTKIF